MSLAVVTGSGGLIGSASARRFAELGMTVVGVDNDMRGYFFGGDGSTRWSVEALRRDLGDAYLHVDADIRDRDALAAVFKEYASDLSLVVHTAAQPSHDWAAAEPYTDFDINAVGTLNLLEAARTHTPEAVFIHCSTNKVYGDTPNALPLRELATRWEIEPSHPYRDGIGEDMSIDASLHSVFGASKVAADVMVQEYGRYFGMRTAVFRGGTLTGPAHSAAELHGFLAYVVRTAMEGRTYRIFGHLGKQVRDVIHCADVVAAFERFYRAPRVGEVYNLGGGRRSNCSVLEALDLAGALVGRPVPREYVDESRVGDHIWWIGSNAKFEAHYPEWTQRYDVPMTMREIYEENLDRWKPA
ncbi:MULTISPECIES: NAD-dependent epimerase/dehydratase family protein [Glycomyces]|uniref:CDP-paratose 2-epimerase n=2 Tax=Glycomyces TaxID=58113 RepID=A0A9X3PPS3_9ACTN|nr:NAD-dependent epimerase/dehydratase family protein [Glycomyces lechevalierae]MDA1387814.1 NAD-dependent epimerase/dehydratase family protein [Glycomyces lechevalierae]MDR7337447.1 CDP-paratose 2-epimerase [Glycomyces lechevalierae]